MVQGHDWNLKRNPMSVVVVYSPYYSKYKVVSKFVNR